MATNPANPCCIAVIYQAARGFRISASKTGPACLSFVVGGGVGEWNGNLFTQAQSLYIGEKLYLPGFIFKNFDSVSEFLLSFLLHTSTHHSHVWESYIPATRELSSPSVVSVYRNNPVGSGVWARRDFVLHPKQVHHQSCSGTGQMRKERYIYVLPS